MGRSALCSCICQLAGVTAIKGLPDDGGDLPGGDLPPATAHPPPPTSAPHPTKPLPLGTTLTVVVPSSEVGDGGCAAVGDSYCLLMLLELPEMGDQPGQCPPSGDTVRRLSGLLELAAKGKVFKEVGSHGTASSSDELAPEAMLTVDGDGSVSLYGGGDSAAHWDYACSLVGFAPTGQTEVMGDGSVRIGVETFAVLPAVHAG